MQNTITKLTAEQIKALPPMPDLTPEQFDIVEDLMDFENLDYVSACYIAKNY